jgi:hypothetical protein
MNEIKKKTRRPVSITVICVIGFIGALVTFPMVFSPAAKQIGAWFPPYLLFSAVTGLVCMVGLWMMKKWAAFTYTGFVVLNQIVSFSMGVWNIMALILPAIVILISLKNVSKMS